VEVFIIVREDGLRVEEGVCRASLWGRLGPGEGLASPGY
jgi:hypothetical protein